MHEESQQGPRAPKHTYSLADYGLTAEQVKERFARAVRGHASRTNGQAIGLRAKM